MEAYIPDRPSDAYQHLLEALDREFTYAFGGCTISESEFDAVFISHEGRFLGEAEGKDKKIDQC